MTTSAISDQTYDISSSFPHVAQTLAWTKSHAACTSAVTYTLQNNPNSGSTPGFITIDGSGNINVASTATAAVYNLQVVGSVGAYTTATPVTFTITITDVCSSATITANGVSSTTVSYTVGASAVTVTVNAYTVNSSCA